MAASGEKSEKKFQKLGPKILEFFFWLFTTCRQAVCQICEIYARTFCKFLELFNPKFFGTPKNFSGVPKSRFLGSKNRIWSRFIVKNHFLTPRDNFFVKKSIFQYPKIGFQASSQICRLFEFLSILSKFFTSSRTKFRR